MSATRTFDQQIDRGVELLKLCLSLQCEKDGIARVAPGAIDRTATYDRFSADIDEAVTNMLALRMLFPMMRQLADLGRELEAQGKLKLGPADHYARAALDHLLGSHAQACDTHG